MGRVSLIIRAYQTIIMEEARRTKKLTALLKFRKKEED